MRSKEKIEARQADMRLRQKIAAGADPSEVVICPRCRRYKLIQEFVPNEKGKRTRAYCYTCRNEYAAEYYSLNRHIIAGKVQRKRLASGMPDYTG